MEYSFTYNRIECRISFVFYEKFFTLVRAKHLSTKSLDISLPHFHTGATMVELSAYLNRAGVEHSLISRSFRNTLNK